MMVYVGIDEASGAAAVFETASEAEEVMVG